MAAFGITTRRTLARARPRHTRSTGTPEAHAPVMAMVAAGATPITYLLVVPPFEPPDELAHFQYARFVATTGTLPRAVPAPRLRVARRVVRVRAAAALLPRRRGRPAGAGLAAPGPELMLNPRSRMQPWRHRADDLPARRFAAASAGAPRTAPAARLVSLLMALATTWLIARLLTTVTADPLVIATVAGGLGLIPQWCAVMGVGVHRSAGDAAGGGGDPRHRPRRGRATRSTDGCC